MPRFDQNTKERLEASRDDVLKRLRELLNELMTGDRIYPGGNRQDGPWVVTNEEVVAIVRLVEVCRMLLDNEAVDLSLPIPAEIKALIEGPELREFVADLGDGN